MDREETLRMQIMEQVKKHKKTMLLLDVIEPYIDENFDCDKLDALRCNLSYCNRSLEFLNSVLEKFIWGENK